MVEVTIDGQKVEVPEGSMVMQAANQLGLYVPHFCYHKKLSIAANCRMCLVDVEKAPKPMPACATPVTPGMIVHTKSEKAIKAQKGVMEFLLINHPLDCPICDQGGECQLQDLAVGYGASGSRYTEEKRVVFHKNIGPLVGAEEMTRCIHCTRCVRFGQEIAGVMELGMANRGEHSEILSFVGRTVDSELSGNMIDLCPVGALTSKPFRYTARTWELSRRRSVSPHDSLGSNLIVQVKLNKVMRVLPLENEAINECWISDRDRFSYQGLNSPARLTQPMVKKNGRLQAVDWSEALDAVSAGIKKAVAAHGGGAIGALAGANSTVEELGLLAKLMRGLGSDNIDFRLRQTDFALDGKRKGVPWLGMPIAEVGHQDRMLLIGSHLRKDHPLLAARVRAGVKHGMQLCVLHVMEQDLLVPATQQVVTPSRLVAALAEIAAGVAAAKGVAAPAEAQGAQAGERARAIADSLASGERRAVLLGNTAVQHPQASTLHTLAQWIADTTGATLGVLTESANAVGGYLAGAYPQKSGLNAARMLAQPLKAYVLLNVEPALDCADGVAAQRAIEKAEFVVALNAYADAVPPSVDVLLPVGPFTETSGTFVNAEGTVQGFNGAVQPLGDARPAWKVLRVLGNMLEQPGFDYDSSDEVRNEILGTLDVAGRLSNAVSGTAEAAALSAPQAGELERIGDVGLYWSDAIVRRAEALQETADARPPHAEMHPDTLARLGLAADARVKVKSAQGEAVLPVRANARVPAGAVRVPAGHASTAALGPLFGNLRVEAA